MDIKIELKPESERRTTPFKPSEQLPFGKLRTDHMFMMDYENGEWGNARIIPYSDFHIAPGAISLHYGQSIFEGAKAFQHDDGEIYTFRIDKNAKRMNHSADALCIPQISEDIQIKAVHALIDIDRNWFPLQEDASLYIRPFIFATQDSLGVHPSSTYTFSVILSPSGPYYAEGFTKAIKLLITKKFHRAAPGGTGNAKASGNYAASLKAGEFAASKSASQVLYLSADNKYIEEAGAMNHFHIDKNDTVYIPEFTDSVLRSITSESVIEIQDKLGVKVVQGRFTIDDFIKDVKEKRIIEAGGFGTAAVISPVGEYVFEDGSSIVVDNGEIGGVTKRIYDYYTGMQRGKIETPEGWNKKVERKY